MLPKERKTVGPSINHREIADTILSKELGSIFNINLPEGFEFSEKDFNRINSLFRAKTGLPAAKEVKGLRTSPDFFIMVNETAVTVYTDTSWNLGLFKLAFEQIQEVLHLHADAYPLIMNKLSEKMPREERELIGVFSEEVKTTLRLVMDFNLLPPSVITALRLLTRDPRQALQ